MSEPTRGEPGDGENDPGTAQLARRLARNRPEPGASFRGQMRAFLAAVDASGLLISRPRQLWLRVGVCVVAGAALLALVAAGVGGWGPFAA
jgi:hypothetical protein